MVVIRSTFFVFVSVCSVCISTVVEHDGLELSPPWKETYRYVNENYKVTCRYFKNDKNLQWLRPNRTTITEKDPGIRVQNVQYGVMLIFENILLDAGGEYSCFAEGLLHTTFELHVTEPVVFTSPTIFEAFLNDDVFLECKVSEKHVPARHWEFGGEILTGGPYEHQMEGLMIRHVGLENAGKYYCVIAHNPFQTNRNRLEITLIVYTKPIPRRINFTQYGFMNEVSSVPCEVSANPEARFIWYDKYENALNPKNDNVTIINENNISILQVSLTTSRREFICEACNELGCANQTVTLERTTKLKAPEFGVWDLTSDAVDLYVSFQDKTTYYTFEYFYFIYDDQWKNPYRINFSTAHRKPSLGNYMRFNITNLFADTKYVVRVAAGNNHTRSEFSKERKFKTKFGRTVDLICCATSGRKYNVTLLILLVVISLI